MAHLSLVCLFVLRAAGVWFGQLASWRIGVCTGMADVLFVSEAEEENSMISIASRGLRCGPFRDERLPRRASDKSMFAGALLGAELH